MYRPINPIHIFNIVNNSVSFLGAFEFRIQLLHQLTKQDIQQKLKWITFNNIVDIVVQVSKQAKEFLEFVYEEPLLDVQQLNPCLYEHCEALAGVLKLRQQLQSLRAYLFSCRATVAEDLRRR